MSWSTDIHDTQSGDLLSKVDYLSGAWGRGDTTIRQTRVKLHDKYTKAQWRDLLASWWDRQILYCWDGGPVYAGTIIKAPSYDRKNHILTIAHVDISLVQSRRWLHGVGTSNGEGGYSPSGGFSVSGKSLQGAIVEVLDRLYKAPISPAWPLPIDLPAAGGGSFSKRWPFYNFQSGAEIIRALTEDDGGPDLDLQPKLVGGKLRWDQRIGAPLTGPAFDIYADADRSAAEFVGFGMDGEKTATGIHYPGKGSEEDMRVGAAFLPPSAGLARDTIFWNKNESNVTRLVSEANGRLNGLTRAVISRPLVVKASSIDPSALRIGSLITIHSEDKYWEAAKSVCRVVGFNGGVGDTYTIELQEVSSTL